MRIMPYDEIGLFFRLSEKRNKARPTGSVSDEVSGARFDTSDSFYGRVYSTSSIEATGSFHTRSCKLSLPFKEVAVAFMKARGGCRRSHPWTSLTEAL